MNVLTPAETALRYASIGWSVIPVEGKRPVGDAWQIKASCDQAKVSRLFAQSSHDGVGVIVGPRSGLIDFDCDSAEAEETLIRLFDGAIPKTPSFKSTRGRHALFKWTDKLPRPDLIKIVVDGLEIRTGSGEKGAQTVFPPSGERIWTTDPDDCELAEIPANVIEKINARYAELNQPKAVVRQAMVSTESNCGNDALNVPRWLAKHGREIIGRTDGSDGVTRWHIECPNIGSHSTENSWRDCCVTQSPTGVLGGGCFHASCGISSWNELKTAIGPLTYEDYHAGEIDFAAIDTTCVLAGTPVEESKVDNDSAIWNPGGLIGQIIDFNLRTAHCRQPELAFGAAIALLATIIGRKRCDQNDTRPNIYLVGVAGSGAGKEQGRKVNKLLLLLAGSDEMAQDSLASSAGLHSILSINPSTLLQVDEFGRFLATLANPAKAPHLSQIIDVLLKLYSQSDSVYCAPCYGDAKKNIRVAYPNLVLWATTTPGNFFGALTREALCDGFWSRLLIVEASNNDPDPQDPEPLDVPRGLVEEIRWWIDHNPGTGSLSDKNPIARRLATSPEAKAEFDSLQKIVRKNRRDEEKRGTQIWVRCVENARKLALINQCSTDRESIAISGTAAEWACRLALRLTSRMESLAEAHVADGQFDADGKKLLRFIKGESNGRTQSEISRHMRSFDSRQLRELLLKLVEMGEIQASKRPSASGPPANTYAATLMGTTTTLPGVC